MVPNEAISPYVPSSLAEADKLAQRLAASNLVPDALKGKPGDILIILMLGHELGLAPMQALRSVVVINGKPIVSADLAVSLVKKHTSCSFFRLVSTDDSQATYETERKGEGRTKMIWTMQQAVAAGLAGRGPWKAHPAAMLRARASLALARAVYPDVLLGVYSPDEAEEMKPGSTIHGQLETTATLGAAQVVESPPLAIVAQSVVEKPKAEPEEAQLVPPTGEDPAAVILERIQASETLAELRSLAGSIKEKGLGSVPAVRDAYASKQAELRRAGGR